MAKYWAKYKCNYCGYEFEREIIKGSGNGKKHNYSSMVECLRCGNFAKTWEDAKDLKEIKTK